MVQAELSAVQPYQEGCLRAQWLDARHLVLAETDDRLNIPFHILKHFPSPLLSFPECCNCGDGGEDGSIIVFVGPEIAKELVPQRLVRHYGV